jgi:hypothetical protein
MSDDSREIPGGDFVETSLVNWHPYRSGGCLARQKRTRTPENREWDIDDL